LYCLSLDLRFWLPLWYFFFNTIVLSVPWFTASDYLFGTFSLIPLYRDRKIFPPPKKGKQFGLLFSWTDFAMQLRYCWTQY
jgi:hypothetical protein